MGTSVLLLLVALVPAPSLAQAPVCATTAECAQMTRAAIAAGDFERAHDLAWLAFQKAPRNDLASMALVARAQSLSGRADDSFVMLRRIAEAGGSVGDVHASDDFRRVRADARWPQLAALFPATPATPAATGDSAPPAVSPPLPLPIPPPVPATNEDSPVAAEPASTASLPRATDDLAWPALLPQPQAIAYDSVSARFVLGGTTSDALTVLSQTSTNAASFTRRGWSSGDAVSALVIDPARGDLWVATRGSRGGVLHRLQLISGRRLEVIESLDPGVAADFTALTIASDGVFVIDRLGTRVLRRQLQTKALEIFAPLPPGIEPRSLTSSRTALFIAHRDGLVRVDRGSRLVTAVATGAEVDVSGLQSIAWHEGALWAIQGSAGELRVVRIRLNASGTRATRVETFGHVSSEAATLSGGVYYVLAHDAEGGVVVRAIDVRKVAASR